MSDEFELKDRPVNFDFKGFLLKLLGYWYLFVISILIGLGIAYYINIRKLPVYRMQSMINIKDDSNPLFTESTSLTFNWGGVSKKVNTAKIKLQSRSHNETVVDRLNLYIQYLKQGEYQKEDVYGQVPFKINLNESDFQLINTAFKIKKVSADKYKLRWTTEEAFSGNLMNYNLFETKPFSSKRPVNFSKVVKFGEPISTSFFSGAVEKTDAWENDNTYFFRLQNFNSVVSRHQNITVQPTREDGSVLNLSLTGNNRHKMVDYLNKTAEVLSENMLKRKNLYATQTIGFIDSILQLSRSKLNRVEKKLENFKKKNEILDLTAESEQLNQKLISFDQQEQQLERKLDYYNGLEDYLINKVDYTDVPAPSVANIEESSIQRGIQKIIELSEKRKSYQFSMKESAPEFKSIDREINATKSVLLENMKFSKKSLKKDLKNVRRRIRNIEQKIRKLPQEQQNLLEIERRYDISQETYNAFLSKRNEASLIKAANVSDVEVIEKAKITGKAPVGPNKELNYVMALLIGSFVPFVFVFIVVLFDNKIKNPEDVAQLSPLNILSIIGKSNLPGSLVVLKKPRSPVSESFRGLRTSLQFTFKNKDKKQTNRSILVTSSVSSEGKTFAAINLASVFSLSNKKTLILGLDLRKPKIFDDFNLHNEAGVVDYMVGNSIISDIVQHSGYANLDVITSGTVPPNPSEILMGEKMDQMMAELKERYDYIVMDTPPIGLVADALNLMKFADAKLYMVRQDFTKKGMLGIINEKYEKGEVENISLVLNYFRQKAKYGYGYGYSYGYGYGYGKYGQAYIEQEKKTNLFKKIFKS